eukprot:4877317-Amphidinium_carterae.1
MPGRGTFPFQAAWWLGLDLLTKVGLDWCLSVCLRLLYPQTPPCPTGLTVCHCGINGMELGGYLPPSP